MKKALTIILLLAFAFNSFALAESSHTTGNISVVGAAVESALENGFNRYKDIQAMFDNALSNGYDYCNVSLNQTYTALMINVAIDGLASALRTLESSVGEEANAILMQAKESVFDHCNAIIEMCKMFGRDDISFMFKILDDKSLMESGSIERDLVTIAVVGGEVKGFVTSIDAWDEVTEKDAE